MHLKQKAQNKWIDQSAQSNHTEVSFVKIFKSLLNLMIIETLITITYLTNLSKVS